MKKKLLHMPKVLREEYTLRVFGGESYDPKLNTNEWINWAVGRCECDRNKINKLRGHYKRNEIWYALVALIGSIFAWLKPGIHLIRIIWESIRGK